MWDCRAYLTRVHDGDSFWVLADTQFGQRYEPELRLLDVHAPELRELGGKEVTQCVNDWFSMAAQSQPRRRWNLYIQTVQTKVYEPDQKMTFTRYLATVWRFDDKWCESMQPLGPSLNEHIIKFLANHPEWGPGM